MAEPGDDDHGGAAHPGPALLLSDEPVETYYGENQDLEHFTALIAPQPENPPTLHDILEQVPLAAEHVVPQVEQLVPQLGPEDLLPCLRQGEWDHAFDILDEMVRSGRTVAGAIDAEGRDPLDMRRAHPELALLLRGQAYWELMWREGNVRAAAYYRDRIELLYPDGTSTGSTFVDKLLERVRLTSGCGDVELKHKETYLSVMDYLKIYFPEFRHEVEEGSVRVGLFGERTGGTVRCLACHQKFRGYTPAKLRYHLLHDVAGKQSKCQASTIYIRQEIQAAEEAAAAAALHPAPDGQGDVLDDGAAGPSTPHPLPPPDAVTAHGSTPTTTSTPSPAAYTGDAPAAAADDAPAAAAADAQHEDNGEAPAAADDAQHEDNGEAPAAADDDAQHEDNDESSG